MRPRDADGELIRPEDVLSDEELADYYNQKALEAGRPRPYPNAVGPHGRPQEA